VRPRAGRTSNPSRDSGGLSPARVGIVHESEIFLRGIASCLVDDPNLVVVFAVAHYPPNEDTDVIVASVRAWSEGVYTCPVVVCVDGTETALGGSDSVAAVLPSASITPQQLLASVAAAAAGFRVEFEQRSNDSSPRLDQRGVDVLRLLAQGATTRSISEALYYSERTVKTIIHELERELSADTRAQAVAEALRRGLI
jgi:DNA-binding NarL/FixJ family response regulator